MKSKSPPMSRDWTKTKIENKKNQIEQLEKDFAKCTTRQNSKKAGITHAIKVLNSNLQKLQSELTQTTS